MTRQKRFLLSVNPTQLLLLLHPQPLLVFMKLVRYHDAQLPRSDSHRFFLFFVFLSLRLADADKETQKRYFNIDQSISQADFKTGKLPKQKQNNRTQRSVRAQRRKSLCLRRIKGGKTKG